MTVEKYTKKPVTIEAIKWTGDNLRDVLTFTGKYEKFHEWFESFEDYVKYVKDHGNVFKIFTLEGVMKASVGDFIIKGVSGEFYPCKPDIFEKTYTKGSSKYIGLHDVYRNIEDVDVFQLKELLSHTSGVHFASTHQAKFFVSEVIRAAIDRLKNAES